MAVLSHLLSYFLFYISYFFMGYGMFLSDISLVPILTVEFIIDAVFNAFLINAVL
jgi:hypothetical protein